MNTSDPFPASPAPLKITRRPAPVAEEPSVEHTSSLGGELAADLAALHEREANLRRYEVRLRAWQAQLDEAQSAAGGSAAPFSRAASGAPFTAEPSLEAAWAKFHRARALLETEQNQMRDTRIVLNEMEVQLKRREAELARREALVAQREQALGIGQNAPAPSAMQRLAQAPMQAARSVFKGR